MKSADPSFQEWLQTKEPAVLSRQKTWGMIQTFVIFFLPPKQTPASLV
jgi:hypothetical protein